MSVELVSSGYCVCCSVQSQERSSVKASSNVVLKSSSNEPSLVCLSCKKSHHLACVELFLHRMRTTLPKHVLQNDKWYTVASNVDLRTQCHIAIPKGICCDFRPTLTHASIPKPKPPRDVTDSVGSSFNDILLNTDARSSDEEDDNDLSLNQE